MGALYVVATPIGNLQELAPRAVSVLSECDLIASEDTRQTRKLLSHFDIHTPLVSLHRHNEANRSTEILAQLESEDKHVALTSDAGTPCIADPGATLVREARRRRIPVIAVSGPSSLTAALSVSGLPPLPCTFHGFLPHRGTERNKAVERLASAPVRTHVVFESARRVHDLADRLARRAPEAMACFCRELTKVHERSYFGRIDEVATQLHDDPDAARGEYTIVVYLGPDDDRDHEAGVTETHEAGLSIEGLVADAMARHGESMRDAVRRVAEENDWPRNRVYEAAVRLRERFGLDGPD